MTDGEINNPVPGAGENGMAQQTPESSEAKHRHSGLLLDELTAEIAKQKSVLASSQTKRPPALFVFGKYISAAIAVLLVISYFSYFCFIGLGPEDIWEETRRGNIEAVKEFLDEGGNVNARCSGYYGWTLMHSAAMGGRNDVIKLLLDRGGDINARSNVGQTPLHWAKEKTTVALLLARGVDVNAARDEDGMTPLYGALEIEDNAVTELLISAGADLEAKYDNSTTPLVRAIQRGDYHIIKFILEHGAEVSATDAIGKTALHYAVHRGQLAVLELLIAKGANINAVTMHNDTPLDYAEEESRADIVALLRKHGGKTGKELKEEENE